MLSLAAVSAGYGSFRALFDVSLDVNAGEAVGVIGPNGAGKTTMMRVISGLVPLVSGAMTFDGRSINGLSAHRIVERGIAHVPENRRLFPRLSVDDNLLMGAYLRTDKLGIAADLERIYAMFPILAERQRQDAGTLSGGEQQMCAIGRGLMAAPRVLLIDELSLGLAPRAVELLSETLRKVNATGVAILLVEQDVMNALELANRAYVIDHGRVTKSGPAIGLASDPAICEAYMGLS